MALTQYTTYDSIRAVLGVTTDELEDGTLALELYWNQLAVELDDLSLNLQSDYTTVLALAEETRTDAQRRFYQATQLFAAYAVANMLGSGLPMFGPKDISDGKATVSRFADSPYKATLDRVQKDYNRMKGRLLAAHAGLNSSSITTVSRTYMAVSVPTTDPVTG